MNKICFFISSISQAGGTGRVCTEIANKLSQLGYEVTILSMYGKETFFTLRPQVNAVFAFDEKRPFKLFLPIVIAKLRKHIVEIAPNIIINVDSALFIYSWVSCWSLPVKNIVWEHFNFNISLNARIRVVSRRLAAKYSDAIVTLTDKDSHNWAANLVCKAPVFTISNPSPFNNQVYDNQQRRNIVLSVGRLTHQKGFDRLLEAWQIVKQNKSNDWILHIVGSGEMQQMLENDIAELGISSSVALMPVTNNIDRHYKEAGIYCMTSRFEGFPMVLLEAQSFGLPLVSYDCETGPSEIISEDNGILVKDGDKYAMANALSCLMNNKENRVAMGEKSFEKSFHYNTDAIIKKWVHLFEVVEV